MRYESGAWIHEHHDPNKYGGTWYEYGYPYIDRITDFDEDLVELMKEKPDWDGIFRFVPVSTHADHEPRFINAKEMV